MKQNCGCTTELEIQVNNYKTFIFRTSNALFNSDKKKKSLEKTKEKQKKLQNKIRNSQCTIM